MIVNIKLTTAGLDTGPFNIFSNFDNYQTALATNVEKVSMTSGNYSVSVDNAATIMRVTSIGTCTNYVDLPILPQYQMEIGNFYSSVAAACGSSGEILKISTYAGNLQVGTIINVVTPGSGFVKIYYATQPGFTYLGYILNLSAGSTPNTFVVQSITAC